MLYTRKGIERVIRYAYELCRKRNAKKRLTLVDKANAVRAQDLWTRTFAEVGKEYPEIEQDHALRRRDVHVDAQESRVASTWPWRRTSSATSSPTSAPCCRAGWGSPPAATSTRGASRLFEPIHGSAPKYAGQNKANPLATILAVSLMLNHLGQAEAGAAVEEAVAQCLRTGKVRSPQAGAHKTDELGKMVIAELTRKVG